MNSAISQDTNKINSPEITLGIAGGNLYFGDIKEMNLDLIYRWKNDFSLNDLVIAPPFPVSYVAVQQWLQDNQKDRNQVLFGIFDKDSHELIGIARIMFIDWIGRTADLGLYIGEPKYRGKRLGIEIVNTLLTYGFERLNLRKLSLRVLESNIPAIRCYESCGFTREGCLVNHYWINGSYQNALLMSVFNDSFQAGQRQSIK
jgi:RimJ/RimL family protein N-acetyltransferase